MPRVGWVPEPVEHVVDVGAGEGPAELLAVAGLLTEHTVSNIAFVKL